MEFRKTKYAQKLNPGNRLPRSQKQIYSAVKLFLLKNPMKKDINRIKQRNRALLKKTGRPFQKGNEYWRLRKNFKHSQSTKNMIGFANCGHKGYINQKIKAIERMKYGDNPMKNLEIVKRWRESRKRNKKLKKNRVNAVSLPEVIPSS